MSCTFLAAEAVAEILAAIPSETELSSRAKTALFHLSHAITTALESGEIANVDFMPPPPPLPPGGSTDGEMIDDATTFSLK